jgi:hypothetical protein
MHVSKVMGNKKKSRVTMKKAFSGYQEPIQDYWFPYVYA